MEVVWGRGRYGFHGGAHCSQAEAKFGAVVDDQWNDSDRVKEALEQGLKAAVDAEWQELHGGDTGGRIAERDGVKVRAKSIAFGLEVCVGKSMA